MTRVLPSSLLSAMRMQVSRTERPAVHHVPRLAAGPATASSVVSVGATPAPTRAVVAQPLPPVQIQNPAYTFDYYR